MGEKMKKAMADMSDADKSFFSILFARGFEDFNADDSKKIKDALGDDDYQKWKQAYKKMVDGSDISDLQKMVDEVDDDKREKIETALGDATVKKIQEVFTRWIKDETSDQKGRTNFPPDHHSCLGFCMKNQTKTMMT